MLLVDVVVVLWCSVLLLRMLLLLLLVGLVCSIGSVFGVGIFGCGIGMVVLWGVGDVVGVGVGVVVGVVWVGIVMCWMCCWLLGG